MENFQILMIIRVNFKISLIIIIMMILWCKQWWLGLGDIADKSLKHPKEFKTGEFLCKIEF